MDARVMGPLQTKTNKTFSDKHSVPFKFCELTKLFAGNENKIYSKWRNGNQG